MNGIIHGAIIVSVLSFIEVRLENIPTTTDTTGDPMYLYIVHTAHNTNAEREKNHLQSISYSF